MRISEEEGRAMAGRTLMAALVSWPTAAAAAGVFLIWRGVFGRSRGRIFAALAGIAIVRRATGAAARGGAGIGRSPASRRSPEVVEVKSPAELEPGIASASPEPTFANRVDRPREPRH